MSFPPKTNHLSFLSFFFVAPTQAPPASNSGFGPLVSASGSSVAASDKYAALTELDSLFGTSSSSSNTSFSSGTGFGSSGTSTFGMSSGPNPFSSTTSSVGSGGFQSQQTSNPFQGLGGQLNGPTRSMSPASSIAATSGSGFGSFSTAQPTVSAFGSQPVSSGFGNQLSNTAFGGGQPGGGFGSLTSSQQSSFGGPQQSGWGGMTSQQQMGGGQNMGMPPSSAQQNLSFGGAGMTAMAWNQFGKMGGGQQQQHQQPQMRGQMNFGSNQPGFGSNQGFGTGQPSSGFGGMQPMSGFGASTGSFGANPMSGGSGFGGQQQNTGFGIPGGFGAQPSAFGGGMAGMGGAQFGQQQQMQQFGSWQQSQQVNPFMVSVLWQLVTLLDHTVSMIKTSFYLNTQKFTIILSPNNSNLQVAITHAWHV